MAELTRPKEEKKKITTGSYTYLPSNFNPEELKQYLPPVPQEPFEYKPAYLQNVNQPNTIPEYEVNTIPEYQIEKPVEYKIETEPEYQEEEKIQEKPEEIVEEPPSYLQNLDRLMNSENKEQSNIYPQITIEQNQESNEQFKVPEMIVNPREMYKSKILQEPSSKVEINYDQINTQQQQQQQSLSNLPREKGKNLVQFDKDPNQNHPLFHLLECYIVAEKEYQRSKKLLFNSLGQHESLTESCWHVRDLVVTIPGGNCQTCGKRLIDKSENIINASMINENYEKTKNEIENTKNIFKNKKLPNEYYREKYKNEVDIYIDNYVSSCTFLSTITSEGLIVVIPESNYDNQSRGEIIQIKEFLKILFYFLQISTNEDYEEAKLFFDHIHYLIIRLGALLLRCGTSLDHCFLVYLLLLSPPATLDDWNGCCLLQFPQYWDTSSSSSHHFLSMLSCVLEHNENPNEKNIENLLEQFPFIEFFKFLFYSPNEPSILLDNCNGMIQIITPALIKYENNHQICSLLTKLLVIAIKHICKYLYKEKEKNQSNSNSNSHPDLYFDFENIILQFINRISKHSNKGLIQYISTLPFSMIEIQTCWKIFFIIYDIPTEIQKNLFHHKSSSSTNELDEEKWDATIIHYSQIRDNFMKILSENRLLLYSFSSIAISSNNYQLASVICTEIFYASLISPISRSECFKIGKDLIYQICTIYPLCLHRIIDLMNVNINQLNNATLQIIEILPWNKIDLTENSNHYYNIIVQWITSSQPGQSISYFLAAIIIERLSWGYYFYSHEFLLTNQSKKPKISIELTYNIIFLFLNIYFKSLQDSQSSVLKSLLTSSNDDNHEKFKKLSFRIFQKAIFYDTNFNFLKSNEKNEEEDFNFIHSFISQNINSSKKIILPLYILYECTELGKDINQFKKNHLFLDCFISTKQNHPILLRLLHDILPNLILDIRSSSDKIDDNNELNSILPLNFIQKLIKSDFIGPHGLGLLASKLIIQCLFYSNGLHNENSIKQMIQFWIVSFSNNDHFKNNSSKLFFNYIFMAATHMDKCNFIQNCLINDIKSEKQNFFEFCTSFTFQDKQKFSWIGFHFCLLESNKQQKAWKHILTILSDLKDSDEKKLKKKLKSENLNLQKLIIHQIIKYCCEWEFISLLNNYKSQTSTSNQESLLKCDPWTPIVLNWQLFIYLSTQIIPQSITPLQNSLGNLFLKLENSEYQENLQIINLDKNIESMNNFLSTNNNNNVDLNDNNNNVPNLDDNEYHSSDTYSNNNKLFDHQKLLIIVEKLRDFFIIVRSFYNVDYRQNINSNNLLSINANLFIQSIQIPNFLNSNYDSLFLHQIMSIYDIYENIINKSKDYYTLPSYNRIQKEEINDTNNNNKNPLQQSSSMISMDNDDRQSLPPPNFDCFQAKIHALPVLNHRINIQFNCLHRELKSFNEMIDRWNNLDHQHIENIPQLYSLQQSKMETFHCRKSQCRPVQRQIQLDLSMQKNASIFDRIYNGREQLNKLIQQNETMITNEFVLTTIQILFTLNNLLEYIQQESSNQNQHQHQQYNSSNENLKILRNNAENIFIELLNLLNSYSVQFIPLKEFVVSCLQKLEPFVLYSSSNLIFIYEILLKDPIRASICKEMFYPNINRDLFLPLYQLVIRYNQFNDPTTNDYLRSCLDEKTWLESLDFSDLLLHYQQQQQQQQQHENDNFSLDNYPSFSECIQLMKLILSTPDKQEDKFLIISSFHFPLFFEKSLELLISGIQNRTVIPETMHQFVLLIESKKSIISSLSLLKLSKFIFENLQIERKKNGSLFLSNWSVFAPLFQKLNSIFINIYLSSSSSSSFVTYNHDSNNEYLQSCIEIIENLLLPWIGNHSKIPSTDQNNNNNNRNSTQLRDSSGGSIHELAWLASNLPVCIPFLNDYFDFYYHLFSTFPSNDCQLIIIKKFWLSLTNHLLNTTEIYQWKIYNEKILSKNYPWKLFSDSDWKIFAYQITNQVIQFKFKMPLEVCEFWCFIFSFWMSEFQMDANSWKKFFIPLISLLHCYSMPISNDHLKLFRKYLHSIPWNQSIFNDFKSVLNSPLILQLISEKYLGPSTNQNQPPFSDPNFPFDLLQDYPIQSNEHLLFYFLIYLRQPCFASNFKLDITDQSNQFTDYFENFIAYLEFIISWMKKIYQFYSPSFGYIFKRIIFALADEFSFIAPIIVKVYCEEKLVFCLDKFISLHVSESWVKMIKSLIQYFLDKQANLLAPKILGITSVEFADNILLPEFADIILQKYFSIQGNNDWNLILFDFCIVEKFQHPCFQQECVRHGYLLVLYCYFNKLLLVCGNNIQDLRHLIGDVHKVLQNIQKIHNLDHLLLIYFFIIELINIYSKSRKGDQSICGILVDLCNRTSLLGEGKLAPRGPVVLPPHTQLGFKLLRCFLNVQVNPKNGQFIMQPNSKHGDIINREIGSFSKRKDFARFSDAFRPAFNELMNARAGCFANISRLHSLMYHEVYAKLGVNYWKQPSL